MKENFDSPTNIKTSRERRMKKLGEDPLSNNAFAMRDSFKGTFSNSKNHQNKKLESKFLLSFFSKLNFFR